MPNNATYAPYKLFMPNNEPHSPHAPLMLKENVRHGEQFFPLQRYMTCLQDSAPSVTPHWHREAEFMRILEGHCTCQIALQTFDGGPGDLFFIPPEVLHSTTVRPGDVMRSEAYVFHMNFIGGNLADVCGLKYLTPLANQQLIPPYMFASSHALYAPVGTLFEKISRVYAAQEPGYELSLKAALLELIAMLLPFSERGDRLPSLQDEHIQKIKTVLSYIDGHLTERISIDELAGLCYFSQYHFMRFFKEHVGMPCFEYIKKLRLERAAALLEDGQPPLEAALSSGFHNLSYFYREFKKQYGKTPREIQNIKKL